MTSRPATPAASRRPRLRRNAMSDPVPSVVRQSWPQGRHDNGSLSQGTRQIPDETALALTYNGGTYAVMMGTPQNLTDFAVGFSLSEGIVPKTDEIESI